MTIVLDFQKLLEQGRYITILADLSIAEPLNKIQILKKVAKIQDNYKYHTTIQDFLCTSIILLYH